MGFKVVFKRVNSLMVGILNDAEVGGLVVGWAKREDRFSVDDLPLPQTSLSFFIFLPSKDTVNHTTASILERQTIRKLSLLVVSVLWGTKSWLTRVNTFKITPIRGITKHEDIDTFFKEE